MLRALLLVTHGATALGEPCARPDDCSGAGDVCVHPSGGVVPSDAYGAEDCAGADGGPAVCDCHRSDGAAYACTSDEQCQTGSACDTLGECGSWPPPPPFLPDRVSSPPRSPRTTLAPPAS